MICCGGSDDTALLRKFYVRGWNPSHNRRSTQKQPGLSDLYLTMEVELIESFLGRRVCHFIHGYERWKDGNYLTEGMH